jgi:hypothetical protein
MRIPAILFVFAVVGCSDAASTAPVAGAGANAAKVFHETDEAVSLSLVACNGEAVELTGRSHIKVNFTQTPSGHIVSSFSLDYHLSGVGVETGAEYSATQKVTEKAVITDNVAVSTSGVTTRLVGKGKVPNSVLSFTTHTVFANGELRVSHSNVKTTCE